MSTIERIVIIGAGLTGARAAETLRKEGFEGGITLLGDEGERPYLRPPLSKDYLRGRIALDEVFVHPATFYSDNAIDLRALTAATAIDVDGRRVVLDDGGSVPFDRLLIATGAAPRPLPVPGAELPGVHLFRTLADADRLRVASAGAERIVVIGAGWIGSEIAASLRMLGRQVTIVAPDAVPLQRVLGAELGRVYRDLHWEHGVELRLGSRVERLLGSDRVEAVETDGGERLRADLVVVGIGVRPRIELAVAAGLPVGDGIEVGATLESAVAGIFAAGDVASAWHPFYQRTLRIEHWANARFQGAAAARAMLGSMVPYDRIPYFYSDQFDLSMEYTGMASAEDQLVVRGTLASREFVAFWLRDGRVVAAMNANVPGLAKPIDRLIRSRTTVEAGRLMDPAVPIDELAGAVSATA